MTWSYNPSLFSTSPKDVVRLLIGDVLSTDPQMQDEEIAYIASNRGTVYGAAADCCLALASKFGRSVDQQAGTSKISFSQMAKAYTQKAIYFETKSALMGGAMPYAGGISFSDKLIQEANSDRVSPQFTLGMDDNYLPEPAAGTETLEEFKGPMNP